MKTAKSFVGAMLATSLLLAVSCAEPQTTPPAPATSPANDATVAAPVPTMPPIILGGPGLTPSLPAKENVYSVQMELVPSKMVYLPGEQVRLQVVLTNASKGKVEPVVVTSLPPVISLVPAGVFAGPALPPNVDSAKVGRPVKVFPAGTKERKLAVGEKATYDLTWDQKDGDGKQVAPGWYYYETSYSFRKESSQDDVGSGLRKRAFLIQYPQGAMTKTIETSQSRTLSGAPLAVGNEMTMVDVVITLKRVEMNEKGVTFYVLMTSPDNPVSGYNNEVWMGHHASSAQYVIDGVAKDARAPNTKFTESGVQLTWGAFEGDPNYLDPVPIDAKELTFVIPEVTPDWKGPWEFKIPLQ